MAQQLHERAGPPNLADQAPVWAWRQWRGVRRARPDLRAVGHLPPGTRGVRIDLEIEDARSLCSDFDLWHYVLNGWFLPASGIDEQAFDARPDRARILRSWTRIFDLAWCDPDYTVPLAEKSVQAVVWEIRPSDVRDLTCFTAR